MISGGNLPMLLESLEYRVHLDLEELFIRVIHSGKEYLIGVDAQMNQIL
jgi:mannose/fructose-specific phosphotransferase system component IIA